MCFYESPNLYKIVAFFSVNEDSPRALDLVPAETWVKIFEYLNQDELLKSISLVYKNWFEIVSNERKSLTIQGKKNSKKNSKNIADIQSLVSRFPNLKELILKHKIFWITKESPILPLNFDGNPYLVKVGFHGWYDFLREDNCVYKLNQKDWFEAKKYRFVIKNTEPGRVWMNPQENKICVDNIRPENVRHLKLTLHFEGWTMQNDRRQGHLYIWTETLDTDHFSSGRTLLSNLCQTIFFRRYLSSLFCLVLVLCSMNSYQFLSFF